MKDARFYGGRQDLVGLNDGIERGRVIEEQGAEVKSWNGLSLARAPGKGRGRRREPTRERTGIEWVTPVNLSRNSMACPPENARDLPQAIHCFQRRQQYITCVL